MRLAKGWRALLTNLYAVIVNWNLWSDTAACVESLLVAGAPPDRVIVVDNASQDDSAAHLRDRFGPTLPLIPSPRNLGFGAGANLGISHALQHGAAWVLLLNNDTWVAPTFLGELSRAVVQAPPYAIWGPLILYAQQPDRIWNLGDRLIRGSMMTRSLFRGRPEPPGLPTLIPVDFVTGCGMLVRSDVFTRVGLFDPAIFMYGEDVDFCWRARQSGFRLAAAPRAKMWHRVSSSSNRDRPEARYWRIRNQIRFYRKYGRQWQIPLMAIFATARALWLGSQDLVAGRSDLLWPLARGWLHGWFRRDERLSQAC